MLDDQDEIQRDILYGLTDEVVTVALHEGGHFLVAKHLGVDVELRISRPDELDSPEDRWIRGFC